MSEKTPIPEDVGCINGDCIELDLWYPRNEGAQTHVILGLMDVRAADPIRIEYDFERDGWVVLQASRFEWECDDEVMDPDWQEVAFVQAWGRKDPEWLTQGEHG